MKGRWAKEASYVLFTVAAALAPSVARAERIDFVGPFVNGVPVAQVKAGDSFSLLARLSANEEIPLFGYSLNVDISPEPMSRGTVTGNPALSNFYPQQNLIVQGGGTLHPLLSLIVDPGDHGLFVNGVNIEPVPVNLSQPGVNDIFAELVFNTSSDALGSYTFDLGPGSVLSHVPKVEVPFEQIPKTVEIITPEPTALSALALMSLLVMRGRKSKPLQSCQA